MCLSPALQSGEDIVSHQLELQSILHGVHQRYAGRRGRYNKHDTARLRYIKDTAFPGLRFGKMVPERDMAMLSPLPPSRLARHLASPQGHLSRRLHLSAGRQHVHARFEPQVRGLEPADTCTPHLSPSSTIIQGSSSNRQQTRGRARASNSLAEVLLPYPSFAVFTPCLEHLVRKLSRASQLVECMHGAEG